MGVFLRFGEDCRLEEDRNMSSGNFGFRDPMSHAFPDHKIGFAIELHPAVLTKIRPGVFKELRGHCRLLNGHLHVDSKETVGGRLRLQKLRNAREHLVSYAERVASLQGALNILGADTPEVGEALLSTARRALACTLTAVKDLEAATVIPIPQGLNALAGLCGQRIPI